ncbi:aminotransferase class III-fold pyridoxal phosphate-dependent enzyme [bacterium]|nr:aminotransferase class III-fold pyridoxal phosphate-dependent enzyme [bacterium]
MAPSKLPGRPNLTPSQAEDVAAEQFGLVGSAHELPSDRDQNFVLTPSSGPKVVLKVSNLNEKPAFLDCQAKVMSRLSDVGLPVPSVLGQATVQLESGLHHVRLVSWLEGTPLGLANPISDEMEYEVGQLLGKMDRCLDGFTHDGAPKDFVWDLAHAQKTISERLSLLPPDGRAMVQLVLDQYEETVLPVWEDLPHAVIHSDANDYNVLVGEPAMGRRPVTGILDFGDIVHSARIGNAAVAAAYLALHRPDPAEAMCNVLQGYHAEFPLKELEVDVFFALVCTRLAISVCMSAAGRKVEPDNEYLAISEKDAWACLERLTSTYPRLTTYRLRDAVGMEPVPSSASVSTWISDRKGQFAEVVRPGNEAAVEPVLLDFSVSSQQFDPMSLTVPGLADQLIWEYIGEHVGVGRWNEPRLAYAGPQYETTSGERRTIHVGVDLFRPAGAAVYAPLHGTVHSSCAHHELFDYGGCIVLEHRPKNGPVFWTLYGHLSYNSAVSAKKGTAVVAGEPFAELGSYEENGGWVPHLHFQIVTDLLGLEATFPGVAAAGVRRVWHSLSPSPAVLLGLPDWTNTADPPGLSELQARRRAHVGSALSLSYSNPLHIVCGWQQYLYDSGGHAYLDAVNNVPHVGHSNPRVVAALHKQMRTLTTNTRYLHENILAYAERLSALLPDPLEVCFFVNSGSEANDLAIRLARAYTGNTDLIVLDGAYHGNITTLIGISPYKFDGKGGGGKPPGTHVVRMPDSFRGEHKGHTAESGAAYAEDVEQIADQFPGRIAAFMAESVPGCGGQIVPPPGYFSSAAEAVRKAGGVFIADEVQVGMGRAGSVFWGFELDGVVPDIVVLGKPIGNGHPLGAVVTTRAIADAFDNGMEYFNTFGGNPASCAVGLAVLDEIRDQKLQENALAVGNHLKEGLASLAPHHPIIGDVRGVGLFLGVELVRSQTDLEPAAEEASYVANRMRDKGILISTDGPLHNVLKIKPPLVFTKENADFLVRTLGLILNEDFVTARIRS